LSQPSLFGAPSGETATANIDGGSRGNPGPAGYGVRVEKEDGSIVELKEALPLATNNVAEYSGLLAALRWAADNGVSTLRIRSDSELLVKQMNGQYRVKNQGLLPLYEEARALVRRIGRVTFEHVRREFNKDADRLANEAMDEAGASGVRLQPD
jgi:probable phosphoglycerate mutase